MASSQVEIVSSSPFGCVLRDHNRRDQFSNTQTAFQKNLKDYLLHTCISNSTPDENSMNTDGWVRNHTTTTTTTTNNNNNELLSPDSRRHVRVLERWAKARETLTSIDRPKEEERENSPTQSNKSVEIPHLGGVSSLVQRWRGFTETRLNQNPKSNNANVSSMLSSPVLSSRCNSENASLVELPVPRPAPQNDLNDDENPNSLGEAYDESIDERFDTPSMMTEDSFMDWESERTAPSGPPSVQGGRDSTDGGDSERLRVADVIRKLTSENQMQGSLKYWKNEQGASASSSSPHPCEPSLPRLRMMVSDHQAEERSFSSPVVSSPRLRGRQAFNDLLMQLERDRHRELDGLVERRAVSRFSHRGRIQSLLRLKILRREAEVRYDHRPWHSRRQAPIRDQQQQQQHPYSRVVEAQQHSNCEAAVEASQHSHAAAVRPRLISCRGGDTNVEPNLCHEEVRSQQHLHCEATVGNQQHSNSATIGTQQHSYSKEVRVLETAGGEAAVDNRQQSHPTSSESSRSRQGPAVVLLREIFDIRVENDSSTPKTPRGVVVNNNPDMKISSSNPFMEEPQLRNQNLVSHAAEDVHKEASPRSDTQRQGISHEVCNIDSQESAPERLTTSNGWEEDENAEEQEANDQEQTTSNEDRINCDWEEQEASNQQLVRIDQDWTSDVSCPWSEWDEQEANSQQMIETTNDWITDIARPRSDWEGLREARYQEMLDPYLDNEDIRQLLERRSVSTFLSSNLRDTMDQLMISRVERLPQSIGNEQEEEEGFHNRLEQLMLSQMQRQTYSMTSHQEDEEHQEDMVEDQEEEEEEDDEQEQKEEEEEEEDENEEGQEEEEEEEDEEEEESPYSEVGDYVDQVEDHARTWSHDGDHEVSDDSDQVASQSSQQPQSSQGSYPNTPLCPSFINQSSIEMKLIYDLRGHMVQLREEMSELRKSVKSCVNMQAKLQRSINDEVADAVSLAVRRAGKESLNRVPRKRCCCVCYEMHVDCLLYRCGHMCTCFKCAHELQWSSGKCPICRAPIVDVVRAYANDS